MLSKQIFEDPLLINLIHFSELLKCLVVRHKSYIGCCLFVELYSVLNVYVYHCFYIGPRPQLLIMIPAFVGRVLQTAFVSRLTHGVCKQS